MTDVETIRRATQSRLTPVLELGIVLIFLEVLLMVYHAVLFWIFYKASPVNTFATFATSVDTTILMFLFFHFGYVLTPLVDAAHNVRINRDALLQETLAFEVPRATPNYSIAAWIYGNFLASTTKQHPTRAGHPCAVLRI
jgi:hypothetical protein